MSTVDSWYLAQFLNITNSTENELTPTIRLNGTSQDAEQIDPICDPYILARFLNECQQINCCEAYNQRIILLLMSIIFFLTALIVLAGLIGIGLWHRKQVKILSRTIKQLSNYLESFFIGVVKERQRLNLK